MALLIDRQGRVIEHQITNFLDAQVAHALARTVNILLVPPALEVRIDLLQVLHQGSDIRILRGAHEIAPEARKYLQSLLIPWAEERAHPRSGEEHP
ncbi:hypothetical protein D9M68_999070 [compost metagenome]